MHNYIYFETLEVGLVARYKYNKRGDSRRIRCAGLVDACFYNSPMGETGRR